MQFDRAMALLFAGRKVQRLAWVRPDKNTHLKLVTTDGNQLVVMEGVEIVFTRSIPFTKTCGVHGADMAADDWEVVPGDTRAPTPSDGPTYLDFITPDEIFDKGPAAVKQWQDAKRGEIQRVAIQDHVEVSS